MSEEPVGPGSKRRIELEQCAQALGRVIGRVIKGKDGGFNIKGAGFALLLFDFGNKCDLTYVSNAHRGDMIKVLDEFRVHLVADDTDNPTPTAKA